MSARTASAATLLFAIFTIPFGAEAAIARNLSLGATGSDVRELQILLNQDPSTRVAETGVGSPGQETEYFGELTKQAVIRFQEKYRSEVLTPVALARGNGYVGSYTRAKLQSLSVSTHISSGTSGGETPSEGVKVSAPPSITSVEPAIITKRNQTLTITGENFSPSGNEVLATSEPRGSFANLSSINGKILSFTFRFQVAEQLIAHFGTDTLGKERLAEIGKNTHPTPEQKDTNLIPVILTVKTEKGESNPVTLLVDVASLLTTGI